MGKFIIRDGVTEDMPKIMEMIKELARFEKMESGVNIETEDLIRDGFESIPPWFFTIVAERNNDIIGYALCNRAYSSWEARAYYIEDLYVQPDVRKLGVGHKIFKEICTKAKTERVHRIDWHVLKYNNTAIEFYKRHGAYDLCQAEDRTAFRLDHAEILKVANDKE